MYTAESTAQRAEGNIAGKVDDRADLGERSGVGAA